jgi:hypothetical protein
MRIAGRLEQAIRALADQRTLGRHQIADPNVFQTRNVTEARLVFVRNVKILVLDLADLRRSAES